MNARQFVVAGVALVALAGCSTAGEAPAPIAATTVAPDPAEASAAAAKRAAAATDVNAYLAALKAVDAKLAADRNAAVDNGKTICLDLQNGKSDAEAAKSAATTFDIDKSAAAKVVAAARTTLCPAA